MHAYLLIAPKNHINNEVKKLAGKLKVKVLNYQLQKIEDARNLSNLIRLSFQEPTLIVCRDIHEATEETLNAFLKNLEEPQENIYFVLTTPAARKVLPTILSRCQIIKPLGEVSAEFENSEIEKFLNSSVGEKLNYIDKIKDREKAIDLAENTVNFLHSNLHSDRVKYDVVADNLETAIKTYSRLKANGNVNLQLVNFVINLKNV